MIMVIFDNNGDHTRLVFSVHRPPLQYHYSLHQWLRHNGTETTDRRSKHVAHDDTSRNRTARTPTCESSVSVREQLVIRPVILCSLPRLFTSLLLARLCWPVQP